jgi:hypothetical protein
MEEEEKEESKQRSAMSLEYKQRTHSVPPRRQRNEAEEDYDSCWLLGKRMTQRRSSQMRGQHNQKKDCRRR